MKRGKKKKGTRETEDKKTKKFGKKIKMQ